MRLKAFTLFESTVSITLISIVIGMSTLIYSNILDSENPVAYYQAKQEVDRLFYETKKAQSFFTKSFDFDAFVIHQQVSFHNGNKQLFQIDYLVKSGDRELFKESHLVANQQNE